MRRSSPKSRIAFHNSFYPRQGWLAKGLRAIDADCPAPELVTQLGLGERMVPAVMAWLVQCQLVAVSHEA